MNKSKLLTLLSAVILAVGIIVALFPLTMRCGGTKEATRALAQYTDEMSVIDKETCTDMLKEANQYNEDLSMRAVNYVLPDFLREQYNNCLDPTGDGIMGYVEIPKIDVVLPIFHGTDEDVLSTSIGHLEWSSLPVGGLNTHSVLSGHNGLRGAELLRDLDTLENEDVFYIRVLDMTLAYEVDQIIVVEPDDTSALMIEKNRDYCTLMTCTPYGKNTHRLLVRGHRIEMPENAPSINITADATRIEKSTVAFVVAVPLIFILMIVGLIIYLFITDGRKKKSSTDNENDEKESDTGIFKKLISKIRSLFERKKNVESED